MKRLLTILAISTLTSACTEVPSPVPPAPAQSKSSQAVDTNEPIGLTRAQQEKIGITTEAVAVKTLPVIAEATGTVRADTSLTTPVISLAPGRIEEVMVQPGDQVKKGQVLAKIRSDEVAQIQSELLTHLLELRSVKRLALLKQALAQKVFDRKMRLWEEKIAAKADVDQAESELEQAKEEVIATDEKEQTLIISSKERLRLFGSSPKLVDNVVKSRHIQLVFDIVSPRTGIITERDCDAGELVEGGKNLFSVSDLSRVWLVANILENHVRFVKKGLPVNVIVDSLPDEKFSGTLDFVDSRVDAQTRTLPVRATIENSSYRLKPEMFARMEVQVGANTALMVPEPSVQKAGETYLVYVDGPGDTYLEKKVTTGKTTGGYVEIVEGLKPNDKVVVKGSLQLLGQSLQRFSQ
ncbi:MAG: efflux RND transporter periplasmic adaptor subunit [Cyanobacteria bacterium SZAS LIN-3]|nr:efflux RND transporter periplasmic adaptor subunit [Cyanobacteria bacterium SZAS LIN-3]MBS2006468.1 efflux RND transporter periplasmic adaptor subunit [Cyanobacteria bacterium SZAS TMP-1]